MRSWQDGSRFQDDHNGGTESLWRGRSSWCLPPRYQRSLLEIQECQSTQKRKRKSKPSRKFSLAFPAIEPDDANEFSCNHAWKHFKGVMMTRDYQEAWSISTILIHRFRNLGNGKKLRTFYFLAENCISEKFLQHSNKRQKLKLAGHDALDMSSLWQGRNCFVFKCEDRQIKGNEGWRSWSWKRIKSLSKLQTARRSVSPDFSENAHLGRCQTGM